MSAIFNGESSLMNVGKANGLFPAILASTVHDIKNSLGVVLDMINNLAATAVQSDQVGRLSQLEFEAYRINHCLMQLLMIYKIDANKFGLAIGEYPAIDLINEAGTQQLVLSQLNGIELQVECDENLLCYCDQSNVSNALGTVLNNALRYAKSAVILSAVAEADGVKFYIEDDGEGYPEYFLQTDLTAAGDLNWITGNTGLGLFFISLIASMHKNKQKSGFVKIDNHSRLGGARFCLFLP